MTLVLLAFLPILIFGQQKKAGNTIYNDPENYFSIAYPKNWKRVILNPQVRFQAAMENENQIVGLSVALLKSSKDESVTSASYVTEMLGENYNWVEILNLPDVKLIEKKQTLLDKKEAFNLIYENSYTFSGEKYYMKTYVVQTLLKGTVYTISLTAGKDEFEQYFPIFKNIISSFTFAKTKNIPNKKIVKKKLNRH